MIRKYKVTRLHCARTGKKSHYAICPFCGVEVVLYWWSVAGHGKRCDCGAMFFMDGTAEK